MARLESESWPFCCLLKALLLNMWVHKTCFVLAQVPRNKDWKRNIINAINLVIFCSVFPFIKLNWRVILPPIYEIEFKFSATCVVLCCVCCPVTVGIMQ